MYLGPPSCYIVNIALTVIVPGTEGNKVHSALNYLGLGVTAVASAHFSTGEAGKYSVSRGYLVSHLSLFCGTLVCNYLT